MLYIETHVTQYPKLLALLFEGYAGAPNGASHRLCYRLFLCRLLIRKRISQRPKIGDAIFHGPVEDWANARKVTNAQYHFSLHIVRACALFAISFVNWCHREYSRRNVFFLHAIAGSQGGNSLHRVGGSVISLFQLLFLGKNAKSHLGEVGIGFISSVGLHDQSVGNKFQLWGLGTGGDVRPYKQGQHAYGSHSHTDPPLEDAILMSPFRLVE